MLNRPRVPVFRTKCPIRILDEATRLTWKSGSDVPTRRSRPLGQAAAATMPNISLLRLLCDDVRPAAAVRHFVRCQPLLDDRTLGLAVK